MPSYGFSSGASTAPSTGGQFGFWPQYANQGGGSAPQGQSSAPRAAAPTQSYSGDSAPYSGVHNNRGWQAVGAFGVGGPAPYSPPALPPGFGYLQPDGSFGASPTYYNQLRGGGSAGGVGAPQGSVYDQLANSNQLSYGQGLAGYAARQQDVINNLDVLGANERSVLGDQYAREMSSAEQQAISRGLSNSTVRQSMRQGVLSQRDEALRRVENEVRSQKLGLQSQLSGDLLGYAERQSAAQAQAALEQQRLGLMASQMQQQQRQFEASLQLQQQQLFNQYNRQSASYPLPLYGWPGGGAGPGNGGYNFSQIYRGS